MQPEASPVAAGAVPAPPRNLPHLAQLGELDLREVTRLLLRRRVPIIASTVAGVVVATLIAFQMTPLFRAAATILLDARQTQVTDIQSVVSGLPADNKVVLGEMNILTSNNLLSRVVDKTQLLTDAEFNAALAAQNTLLRWLNPLNWLPRAWFTTDLEAEAQQLQERNAVIEALRERLQVINDNASFAIRIQVTSEQSAKAARLANAIADEYLVDQLEAKYEATSRANTWLSGRIADLRTQVETAERAVQEYIEKEGLTQVGNETLIQSQLMQINTQLIQARTEVSQAEARYNSARAMVRQRGGVDAASDVLSSPLIISLRQQESEVRRKEAEYATRYGERHPAMINVRAELRDLQNKIAEEVNKVVQGMANEVDIARAKETSLRQELTNLTARTGADQKKTVVLNQMQREATASRSLYENFLMRFKETDQQTGMAQADARIIDRAQPPLEPYAPNRPLLIALGLLLGAMAGLTIAFLLEYFDRGFRGAAQIEKVTGLPTVGVIPSLGRTNGQTPEQYVLDKPLSAFSESLRTVRTAIHFSNVDHPPKVVLVTSALPGEGKSTLVMALGRVLAKSGNKVLVIDADLRRPRVAKMLGVSKVPDLVDLVSGAKSDDEVIQRDKNSGLHFIVGVANKTPNPQDLLGSEQMRRVIDRLRDRYDLILVDAPPVMAVADAAVLGAMVDTTLFVVRYAETPRDVAANAVGQLRAYGLRVAGVALTQVNLEERAAYGYSDYGYYYGRYKEYYSN